MCFIRVSIRGFFERGRTMEVLAYPLYKCRLCGETFLAQAISFSSSQIGKLRNRIDSGKKVSNPPATLLHFCEERSRRCGVADFVGFEDRSK